MRQDNENQKRINGLGWLFTVSIIVHVLLSLLLSLLENKGITMPVELQLILSEVTILLPVLIYILYRKMSFKEELGFRKIKVGTVFMSLFLTLLILPVMTLVNLLSQLLVPNTMVQASTELLGGSSFVVWFLASIYGPFCEELFFRSVMFNGFSKAAGAKMGMFISALLFGLTHLNLNQFCYAFVLGLLLAIINTASGSVYSSMIIHAGINGFEMLMMLVAFKAADMLGMGVDIAESAELARNSSIMYVYIGFFIVMSIIAIAIGIPCVVWMARHEGNLEKVKGIFVGRKEETQENKVRAFFNVPLIIGVVFSLFIMFGLDPLLSMLGYAAQ